MSGTRGCSFLVRPDIEHAILLLNAVILVPHILLENILMIAEIL